MGIRFYIIFKPGDIIILYNDNSAKKKFHEVYQKSFVIVGFAGYHQKSYSLRQINENPIKQTFYTNHLKLFKPKTEYLVTTNKKDILIYQNLRANTYKTKVLKDPLTRSEVWENVN